VAARDQREPRRGLLHAARGQHYAASKGGVVSMMKALAVELARHKVRANAILPAGSTHR
jgi:NAD(P)-dependent dehydrogenase (short-subunit alcohol dehydrogenase family)